MTEKRPTLQELVGETPDPVERERLERIHALLLATAPSPELSPALAAAPDEPQAKVLPLPRRYRFTAVAAAAVVAIGLFGTGYLVGGGDGPNDPTRQVAMTGPSGAIAELALFEKDAAGNWPMELDVEGLPALPAGKTYELWLTRNGELAESCGTFVVAGRRTTVPLNAPYALKAFSGWVVVETGSHEFVLRTDTV